MTEAVYMIRKEVRDLKVRGVLYPRLFLMKELRMAGIEIGDKVDVVVYPNKIVIQRSNNEG